MWEVVCKKYSGSVSEILVENLECVNEMPGRCPKNLWEVSKILVSFQEVSRMFLENVQALSRKCLSA